MGPLSQSQETCDLHPITGESVMYICVAALFDTLCLLSAAGHVLHCTKEVAHFSAVYTKILQLYVSRPCLVYPCC